MNENKLKPYECGWYYVEMRQSDKLDDNDPGYFKDWRFWNGNEWQYDQYTNCCEVINILEKSNGR